MPSLSSYFGLSQLNVKKNKCYFKGRLGFIFILFKIVIIKRL